MNPISQGTMAYAHVKKDNSDRKAYIRENLILMQSYPVNKLVVRFVRGLGLLLILGPLLALFLFPQIVPQDVLDSFRDTESLALSFICLFFGFIALSTPVNYTIERYALCMTLQDPRKEQKCRWQAGVVYTGEEEAYKAFCAKFQNVQEMARTDVLYMEKPAPTPWDGRKLPPLHNEIAIVFLIISIILLFQGIRFFLGSF